MRNNLYKIATAALAIAITFTLSCSTDDVKDFFEQSSSSDNGLSSSSSSGAFFEQSSSSDNGLSSSSSSGASEYADFVKIGDQYWMAKNLDINAPGSVCNVNDDSNCEKYGRLYDWATAMGLSSVCNESSCDSEIVANHRGICPAGSHIPSAEDWNELFVYAGSENGKDGKYLKSKHDWMSDGNGTDKFGFSALPGGFYSLIEAEDGSLYFSFGQIGYYGLWWSTSTPDDQEFAAYAYSMSYDSEYASGNTYYKSSKYSVRCIKN